MKERSFKLRMGDGEERELHVSGERTGPASAELWVEGVTAKRELVVIRASAEGSWMLELAGSHRLLGRVTAKGVSVSLGGRTLELERISEGAAAAGTLEQDESVVRAPMPGRVVELGVAVGDKVSPDEPVAVVEAMKLQNSVYAARSGVVAEVAVKVGDQVAAEELLISLEEEE